MISPDPLLQLVLPFALQVSSSGAAARDGRLKVGMRILEVNHQSLLGMTHTEAVQILRAVGDTLLVLICDGFDARAVAAMEVRVPASASCSDTLTPPPPHLPGLHCGAATLVPILILNDILKAHCSCSQDMHLALPG